MRFWSCRELSDELILRRRSVVVSALALIRFVLRIRTLESGALLGPLDGACSRIWMLERATGRYLFEGGSCSATTRGFRAETAWKKAASL